jgi:fructose PTS system EIIB component
MKIVAITACPAGIAHTYIAKEKLIKGAQARGHEIYVETQGSVGIEDKLTIEQIAQADIVIFAADIKISGEERFKGKRIVRVPTSAIMKTPSAFIEKVEKALEKQK